MATSQGVGADAAGLRLREVSNCSESHLRVGGTTCPSSVAGLGGVFMVPDTTWP